MEDATRAARGRAWAAALCAALALIVPQGCRTPYLGTTAASFLKNVRESKDPNIRYIAYSKLASTQSYDNDEQKLEAIKVMSQNLLANKEPIASRAVICRTLGELGKPEARPALIKAFGDEEGIVRAEAYRALGKVGKPEDAALLAQKMATDQIQDCRIAAIEGLGELKAKDWRIVGMLVEGMEHDSPAIRFASLKAIREITGKDLGVTPAPWRDYVLKELEDERTAARTKLHEEAKAQGKEQAKGPAAASQPAPRR
ncbi:MAG TPA: HEAT repeat domain-containing protein [Isosphaeraceae bacterium]|jgi:HEAT repeat protein|nr:HEAT repeat domain-containing protein [Isosphaeraceae bacterium]